MITSNSIRYLIILFALLLSCAKQEKGTAIVNIKDNRYEKIKGTNVWIIPPADLSVGNTFGGYFDLQTSTTLTITQMNRRFHEYAANYENIHGGDVKERKQMKINGYDALYLSLTDEGGFEKHILAFGNDDVTVSLVGEYMKKHPERGKQISEAMFTAVLASEKIPDGRDDAPFEVKTNESRLRFARFFSNMLVYTFDGTMSSSSPVSFFVQYRYGAVANKELKETTTDYIRDELFYDDVETSQEGPVNIDGMSGYEITALATHRTLHTREQIYVALLFNKEGSYAIVGTAEEGIKGNTQEMFREVAKTFRRKR